MSLKSLAHYTLLLVTVACASRTPGSSTSVLATRDRNVITQAELSDPTLSSLSVLEVIKARRPNFLSNRGITSNSDPEAGRVHASIDNGRIMSVQELQSVHASRAVEIRFLDAGAAMQRFGGAARQGPVIVVRTM